MAEEIGVLPLQRHRVPGFFLARWRGRPQRKERSPLGDGVTGGAGVKNCLSGIINMLAVMAHKAARPVAMAYVVRIRQPVHLHIRKDTLAVDGRNRFNRLLDEGLLILEGLRIFFSVEPLDSFPDLPGCSLPVRVAFGQGQSGKLLNPGQFGGNISAAQVSVYQGIRCGKHMRRPVMAVHAVHQMDGQLVQFLLRNLDAPIPVNLLGAVRAYQLDPGDLLLFSVERPEIHFIVNDHVPVNTRVFPEPSASTSRFH